MAQRQIVLYPLHDNSDPATLDTSGALYVGHKAGENAVVLVQGYWLDPMNQMVIRGEDKIARLIEALNSVKAELAVETAS